MKSLDQLLADQGESAPAAPSRKGIRSLDAILAEHEAPRNQEPQPEPYKQPGHIDAKAGKWVPDKRVRAVFTDAPEMGAMTAEEIPGQSSNEPTEPKTAAQSMEDLATGRTTPKQNAAFIGGVLQGATLGFGDEAAAGIGALTGQGSYRQLRDENRRADKDAASWDPTLNTAGKLVGSAAIPAGSSSAGKPILSWANTGKAALLGGTQALGESEADLTKGEVGQAALDTAKGAGAGVAANTAMGLAGKGLGAIGRKIAETPERIVEKGKQDFLREAVAPADKTVRDKVAANVDRALEEAKAHDLFSVQKDPKEFAKRAQSAIDNITKDASAILESTGANVPISKFAVEMAKVRDELKASGSTIPLADHVQGEIDNLWAARGGLQKSSAGVPGAFKVPGSDDYWVASGAKPRFTMTPKEAREEVTEMQGRGFGGKFTDPTVTKQMQRDVANAQRKAFMDHVAQHAGPQEAERLSELNKSTSTLINLKDAAEDRITSGAIPKPAKVQRALDRIAGAGLVGAGIAGVSGHGGLSAAAILGAGALHYGPEAIATADRALAAMVTAARHGADIKALRTVGKIAGVSAEVGKQLAESVLPRTAASATAKKTEEE